MLGGDVLVAEAAGLLGGALEHASGTRIEGELSAGDLGPAGQQRRELPAEGGEVDADAAEGLCRDPLLVLDEGGKDVLGVEDGALEALGQRPGLRRSPPGPSG